MASRTGGEGVGSTVTLSPQHLPEGRIHSACKMVSKSSTLSTVKMMS